MIEPTGGGDAPVSGPPVSGRIGTGLQLLLPSVTELPSYREKETVDLPGEVEATGSEGDGRGSRAGSARSVGSGKSSSSSSIGDSSASPRDHR